MVNQHLIYSLRLNYFLNQIMIVVVHENIVKVLPMDSKNLLELSRLKTKERLNLKNEDSPY